MRARADTHAHARADTHTQARTRTHARTCARAHTTVCACACARGAMRGLQTRHGCVRMLMPRKASSAEHRSMVRMVENFSSRPEMVRPGRKVSTIPKRATLSSPNGKAFQRGHPRRQPTGRTAGKPATAADQLKADAHLGAAHRSQTGASQASAAADGLQRGKALRLQHTHCISLGSREMLAHCAAEANGKE